MNDILLRPGEFHFGDRHTRIRTLLGSCVSLVIWHQQRRIGGMCHFMLPYRPRLRVQVPDARFGDDAIGFLLQATHAAKADPGEFHIRLFGGGNMFPTIARRNTANIGQQNVEAARCILASHGMRIDAEHVEGVGHRHLVFNVDDGHVALRHATVQPSDGMAGGIQQYWLLTEEKI